MSGNRLAALLALGAFAFSGCTLGTFESARTTPRGSMAMELSHTFALNENTDERPFVYAWHPQLGFRAGVTDHLDLGFRFFMGAGGLLDAKYNFFGPDSSVALALQGGFGAAGDWDESGAYTLHLPLRVLVSYLAWDRFEPFASVGYGFFWVFGRERTQPGVNYAERKGYGDGVLTLTVGARVVLYRRERSTAILSGGYSFWWAAVDDPGDFFSFVNNHFVGLAYTMEFHFGRRRNRAHEETPEPEIQEPDYPDTPEGVESPW